VQILTVGILGSALICSNVIAKQCDVNFNYGVVIDPHHIRMLDHHQTYVQINGQDQLFVNGREISLNNEQQALLSQYTSGIRQQVPDIISIAIEGVDIGLKAVNRVIGGLTGENSASHLKFQKKFDDMQSRLRKRFNHSDNNYYIGAQDFDDLDEIFAGKFENEIEEIVSDSIGTILTALGEAITSDDDTQNNEKRVDTFDERMTSMGKDLKLEISTRVNSLEQKSDVFCQNLIQLDIIETKLQRSIYQLLEFDLIKTSAE
jgi:hypothetical protein